ncbi:MAG: type II secretion system protein GspG [Puniceicoccales bacterium]|jgi:type II secretory pathway pseudopilin PulG|nr:type II secretion system protein GspG [Puniceicoccales bacterium]
MGSVIYGKRNLGFSPIEILCALGVMLILFVVFFRIYAYRDNDIKYQIAREELSILNCALEYYHSSCGEYPVGNQRSIEQNAISMYAALTKSSKNFLTGHEWKIASNKILDPWGRPYIYKCSGKPEDNYILFSMGPNGYVDEHGLLDDIYSR